MTLKKVGLTNIAVFENFNLELSDGINIIIGENGSGKTIFLKSIYHTCHGKKQDVLDNKYIRKHNDNTDYLPNIVIEYGMENGNTDSCWLMENGQKSCINGTNDVLYIPVMEMLSHSKGLISLYEKYDLPFETVQIDIIQNAQLPETRKPADYEKKLLKIISEVIDGEVVYENEKFFVRKKDGFKIDFEMEAEGFRKFALLWKLIRNGLLQPGSILLWDEPETNINPELLPTLADVLLELQKNHIQIILATHSYNLAKYFELKKEEDDHILFHSFQRNENKICAVSSTFFGNITANKLIQADEKLLDLAYTKGMAD